ncbi:hypothetical protein B0T13DRAFT_485407 [Neurospora crassa]|nr:hypothetical protein B0T13DRAFT_485407 [Neurospora crassa]
MKLIKGEGRAPAMIDLEGKGTEGARARRLPVQHLCRPGIGSRSSQQNASRQSAKDERNVTAPSTTPQRPNLSAENFCAAQGDKSDSNVTADNGGDPRRLRTLY